MNLLAIALFSQHLINAIGTTLLHSLWQGLILVGVTGLIILSTRSRKPALRYNLLISSLAVFFVVNLITFINACTFATPHLVAGFSTGKQNLISLIPDAALFSEAKAYLANHNQTVVLIWFLIVAARCFQLFIGVNGLNHLRKNTNPISAEWEAKAESLAKQLGIKEAIRIAECGLIRVPMVIGHLKPLILLPLGLLTALPPKEIEAILVHELAHIYRRDYLVNLLQSVMEILFFFNPAVLWLSALIKAERENCCDDIAISQTTSKVNYISALIACQEYQQAAPAYAMTFYKKGHLRNRVSRLIHNTNRSLNGFEKSILICCMVAASLVLLAFVNEAKIEKIVNQTTSGLKTAMVEMQEKVDKTEERPEIKVSTKTVFHHEELRKIDSIHQRLAKESEIINDSLKTLSNQQKATDEHRRLARLDSVRSPLNKGASISNYKSTAQNYKTESRRYVKPDLGDLVKEELISDGIITNLKTVASFMLSEKEMIVNGKRIPQEIYQKYREKYVPAVGKNGWTLYYNYDTSVTVSIS